MCFGIDKLVCAWLAFSTKPGSHSEVSQDREAVASEEPTGEVRKFGPQGVNTDTGLWKGLAIHGQSN